MVKEVPEIINRVPKWYFGGCASALAACLTHPLDLLKVHLQTAKHHNEFKLIPRINKIIEVQGAGALYNGLSASLFRQLTYSTTRFGLYEVLKQASGKNDKDLPFHTKVLFAAISGATGGMIGTPGDLVNVRMQNDIKLPIDMRRHYMHIFDGLTRVIQFEGVRTLFSGATMATTRAVLMTVGQLSIYDQIKQTMLTRPDIFEDDVGTHMLASLLAGTCATTLTLPLDVCKTRLMNSNPGVYKGNFDVARVVYKELGIRGFFRGFVPSFIRLTPQTILTFSILERLRIYWGTPVYSRIEVPFIDEPQ